MFQPFNLVSLIRIKFWGGSGTAPLMLLPWETSHGVWLGTWLLVDIWVYLGVYYSRKPSYRAEAVGWDRRCRHCFPVTLEVAQRRVLLVCDPVPYVKTLLLLSKQPSHI